MLLSLIVELVWQAWVGATSLGGTQQTLLTTLAQRFLQQDDISSIALVHRISKIADERDEADDEVDQNVELHSKLESAIQPRFDGAYCAIHHPGKERVTNVTQTGYEANDRAIADLCS